MWKTSKGKRRRSKFIFKRKGIFSLNSEFLEVNLGEKFMLKINGVERKGKCMPHKRFNNLIGKVIEKNKKSCILEIPFKKKKKKIITGYRHLKKIW